MRSGSLTTPISIYTISGTTNSLGEVEKTTAILLCNVRANVRYKRGNESEDNSQITPYSVIVLTIRYMKSVREDMIVLHSGEWYEIRDIAHYDRDRTVIIIEKSKKSYTIQE